MSGIAGIFHRDGAPVAPPQLQPLLDELITQGPDTRANLVQDNVWALDNVAFAHAPVTTDAQPAILAEAQLAITGDVRLDDRETLRAQLAAANRNVGAHPSDVLLILHAYGAWGLDCTTRLRGDFAFAIWDANAQALFCARDHFGIKPFYYSLFPELFLFSNSLTALRRHPQVSQKLNDSAVADFLLFGLNCDNSTTTFQDIQRLPPAHSLLVSRDTVRVARYWNVPADGRIRYPQPADYVVNFLEVWNAAIADRLDSNPTGVLLSGGLDSSAVAAIASAQASSHANPLALRAFTITNGLARNDLDATFAAEIAAALKIPWESVSAGDAPNLEAILGSAKLPEPVDDPLFAREVSTYHKMSAHTRVLLSGEGADNLMHFEMWPYASDLRARGEWGTLLSEVARYAWRRPFPWRGIGARLQNCIGAGPDSAQPFPKWIAPDFAKRLDLRSRWRFGQPLPAPPQPHPVHPTAVSSMYLPQWTRLFELESAGVTKCPLEVRYPFLDLRVVEYLLAIPPFPWSFQKTLLREAMAGRVLESVRLRPKTPFRGDPLLLHLQRFGPVGVEAFGSANAVSNAAVSVFQFGASSGASHIGRSGEMDLYINRSVLSPLHGKMTAEQVNQMARPFCFNFWLQSLREVGYN